jgi:hypothetical protein
LTTPHICGDDVYLTWSHPLLYHYLLLQAIDNNRHAVLMTLINAHPMVQVKKLRHPAQVGIHSEG